MLAEFGHHLRGNGENSRSSPPISRLDGEHRLTGANSLAYLGNYDLDGTVGRSAQRVLFEATTGR